jgi:hypothetical protein
MRRHSNGTIQNGMELYSKRIIRHEVKLTRDRLCCQLTLSAIKLIKLHQRRTSHLIR